MSASKPGALTNARITWGAVPVDHVTPAPVDLLGRRCRLSWTPTPSRGCGHVTGTFLAVPPLPDARNGESV